MNPYDALRKIHSITVGTRPKSATGAIDRVCSEVLACQHQPGPYATQGDALEAIRSAMSKPCFHASELLTIAEQGLLLPAIELTPAQQKADLAVEMALRCFALMHRSGPYRKGSDAGDLYYDLRDHIEPLRPKPPCPPTLDEALAVLRDLFDVTHGYDAAKPSHTKARQLLARVPK